MGDLFVGELFAADKGEERGSGQLRGIVDLLRVGGGEVLVGGDGSVTVLKLLLHLPPHFRSYMCQDNWNPELGGGGSYKI